MALTSFLEVLEEIKLEFEVNRRPPTQVTEAVLKIAWREYWAEYLTIAEIQEVVKKASDVYALAPDTPGEEYRRDESAEKLKREAVTSRKRAKPSSLGIIDGLPADIHKAVDTMLFVENKSYREIATFLQQQGVQISRAGLSRYYSRMSSR